MVPHQFFHWFFVSGLTTAELVCVHTVVIETITMYTVSQQASIMWVMVCGTLRQIVLYRVRLTANKMAGRDGWWAPSHGL